MSHKIFIIAQRNSDPGDVPSLNLQARNRDLEGVLPNSLQPEAAPDPEGPSDTPTAMSQDTVIDRWKSPPSYAAMTSSVYSRFFIMDPKPSYSIGDHMTIRIQTRTDRNEPKTVGGDYFRAKMSSLKERASISTDGEVMDLQNGWYEANFTLRWPGKGVVDVVLVQTAEALEIVQEIVDNHPMKMVYIGKFGKGTTTEIRRCNIIPPLVS